MTFGGVNFQMASVVVSLPNDPNRLGMTQGLLLRAHSRPKSALRIHQRKMKLYSSSK